MLGERIATERSDLQEGYDSLEPVVVGILGQRSSDKVQKACENLG